MARVYNANTRRKAEICPNLCVCGGKRPHTVIKVKNNQLIEILETLVHECRKRLNSLDIELNDIDID